MRHTACTRRATRRRGAHHHRDEPMLLSLQDPAEKPAPRSPPSAPTGAPSGDPPIFISFRVLEARTHAIKLKRALAARGYEAFCSETDIPFGQEW